MALIIDPLASTTAPYGRLTTLSQYSTSAAALLAGQNPTSRALVINFPASPETVKLPRSAVYDVQPNWYAPDGFSMYNHTEPFTVEVSFKLHHLDCTRGALTLLQLAGAFHALVTPISTSNVINATPASNPAATNSDAGKSQGFQPTTLTGANGTVIQVNPPVVCWLNLINAGPGLPGINCIGYVKDVVADLKRPFMQGPNGEVNLPTAGEFSFTFFHSPSYSNVPSGTGSQTVQAFADDMKSVLYNTLNLLTQAPNYTATGFNK